MATPAARTLQKRYTAGSCTLDVELQLLALSKWYPQPIAQDLQFKLWMNTDAAATDSAPLPAAEDLPAELVAQGDRAALQTLSQAVSQKVRGLLEIAHLNTPNPTRPRPPVSPSPLPGLSLTQPLSYLQICDLSSVLYQCEQATPALPVSLGVAETATETAAETAAEPRRNNLIPFAAIRRRPPLWASSAAAALLAVGLTTTLWPSLQSNPDLSTTADSKTADLKADPSLESPNASPQNAKNPSATGNTVARAPSNASKPPAADAPTAPATNSARNSAARNSATAPLADPAPSTTPVPESAAERDRSLTAKQPTPANEPPLNTSEPNAAVTAPNPPAPANPAAPAVRPQEAARSANLPEAAPSDNSQSSGAESFSTADVPSENELNSAAASNQNLAQQDLIAIEQVQNYFQSQWQATSSSQTLSYEVQLSEIGEVVGFVALSEAAESYRDRLLPNNQPLMFAPSSTGAGLTLQLDLLPNGEVQVYQP